MKIIVIISSIFLCSKMVGLPVGNPAEASLLCDAVAWDWYVDCCGWGNCCCVETWEKVSLRLGYRGNFTFHRTFESQETKKNLSKFKLANNSITIALNYFNRIDIFGSLGGARLKIEGNSTVFELPPSWMIIDTGTETSWSVGTRVTLWYCQCLYLGAVAEYFGTNPHIHSISEGAVMGFDFDHSAHLPYRELQVAGGVTGKLRCFYPYATLKWAHVKIANLDAPIVIDVISTRLANLRNKKKIGYTVGLTYVPVGAVALSIEGCFVDDLTLGVNATLRF